MAPTRTSARDSGGRSRAQLARTDQASMNTTEIYLIDVEHLLRVLPDLAPGSH